MRHKAPYRQLLRRPCRSHRRRHLLEHDRNADRRLRPTQPRPLNAVPQARRTETRRNSKDPIHLYDSVTPRHPGIHAVERRAHPQQRQGGPPEHAIAAEAHAPVRWPDSMASRRLRRRQHPMHREAPCHDEVACHAVPQLGGSVRHAAKARKTQRRCSADARECALMGLGPAWSFTAGHRPTRPEQPCRFGGPCRIRVHLRASVLHLR
jgi:hypothetical protein